MKGKGRRIWLGIDEFAKFGGSKEGPLDGEMKIVQIWV